jgi:GNAT superfamily N-acetyltransferase
MQLTNGEYLTIRPLSQEDSIGDITLLLNAAYAELLAHGFRFLASHQDDTITAERLNGNLSFVAVVNKKIVGTISLYDAPELCECELYAQEGVWRFGQFGILPKYQRNRIGSLLMEVIEHTARTGGAKQLALDTAESAEHLIRWYSSRGYDFVQHVQWDVTNYRSVVMSKTL